MISFARSLLHKSWLGALILVLATFLRIDGLDQKPVHFDEGVNGWWCDQMASRGYYPYSPEDYHGPCYFYLLFASLQIGGRNEWALRIPAVLCSIALVWVILRLAPWLGRSGARLAAFAVATSPAMVFYGRYSIHESLFALTLAGLLWASLSILLPKQNAQGSLAPWTWLGVASGVMLASKETWVIHIGSVLIALLMVYAYQAVRRIPFGAQPVLLTVGIALSIIPLLLIPTLFYTGFGRWPEGLGKFFESFAFWAATGLEEESGHEKPEGVLYWAKLMGQFEWASFLGFLLTPLVLLKAFPSYVRCLAVATNGMHLAYAIIPYKTPWCIVSFLWLYPVVAALILKNFSVKHTRIKAGVGLVILLAGLIQLLPTWRLNFVDPTDPKHPYVYVQTSTEIERFVEPIQNRLRNDPTAVELRGVILSHSYFPIPWLLGEFRNLAYYGEGRFPELGNPDFVLSDGERLERVEKELSLSEYTKVSFILRDGLEPHHAFFRNHAFPELATHDP
ncbi:MAG: glycosyltransferase family 39 protein [Verrucomicrobiales bacterium]